MNDFLPKKKEKKIWDFPGGPLVKTLLSNAVGVSSILGH